MIFAAGLGTRLGRISHDTPKALIQVGGVTMLERTARRLVDAGAERLIVNVHHHADAMARFVETHDLGAEVVLSHERQEPLETGGGLLHARALFRGRPFFLHNVDVITDVDLRDMYAAHARTGALVTLAAHDRDSSRKLLFDDEGLVGRVDARQRIRTLVRAPRGPLRALAFAGIHVVSPTFFDLVTERGIFSVIEAWVRLAGDGHRLVVYPVDEATWFEIGTPERLEAARRALG